MGRRMSSALLRRPPALALAFAIAFLVSVVAAVPTARADTSPVVPAAAMTVTVALDKSSYLSGDGATATAIVYRTPSPGNYTYSWRVRDLFGGVLNQTPNGAAQFTYAIPLTFTGTLRFDVTVDDGAGLVVTSPVRNAPVSLAYMSLSLDRGDFNPGDTITAYYGVASHVILNPKYDYEVDDETALAVLTGNTTQSFFSFTTPDPASRTYTFHVTATDGANSTEAHASIAQAAGFVLGMTFDKPSYAAGETVHAHLTLTARGMTALPSQFRWTLAFAAVSVSATTTAPQADLVLTLPQGTGSGDILVFASESNTGASAFQTVNIGESKNALWSTEIAGIPAFAVALGLLFLLLLVAVVGLWRRVGGGRMAGLGPEGKPAPPPLERPVRAPPASPMSVMCRNCGKPIDLTTSKRPIEVMCPSCGETQLVI